MSNNKINEISDTNADENNTMHYTINSLSEILNSLANNEDNDNIKNNTKDNIISNSNTNTDTNTKPIVNANESDISNYSSNNTFNDNTIIKNNSYSENNEISNNTTNHIQSQIQLFSHDIDRKIGSYLLNELESKKSYIDELENVIKFQQEEISELKSKLESINKLELIAKLKTGFIHPNSTKSDSIEGTEYDTDAVAVAVPNQKPKVVHVKKVIQVNQNNSNTIRNEQYNQSSSYGTNPDLVLGSNLDSREKTKSISKDEEEPRYCGITIVERPPQKQTQKIVLDYDSNSEMSESQSNSVEIIKQRRRAARL